MLIQWPDRFYHTSADTPDRTDPHSLARAAALAAVYAYWLATAGAQAATWLGYEMVARFRQSVSEAARQAIRESLSVRDGHTLAQSLAELDRRLAYLLGRHRDAVRSLERLGRVECPVEDLLVEAERAANRELAWAKSFVDLRAASLGLESLPELPARDLMDDEREAATLVPVRQVTGPIPLSDHLRRLDEDTRESWRQLLKERKGWLHYTLTTLALFWADGNRPVLEIADLVELESGQRDVALFLAYFRLLEQLGFIAFR
jgi:hypothetical protein